MNLQRTGQRSIKTFDFGHEIWRSNFPFSGKDKSLLRNILTTKELSVLTCSFFCNKINIAKSLEIFFFFFLPHLRQFELLKAKSR